MAKNLPFNLSEEKMCRSCGYSCSLLSFATAKLRRFSGSSSLLGLDCFYCRRRFSIDALLAGKAAEHGGIVPVSERLHIFEVQLKAAIQWRSDLKVHLGVVLQPEWLFQEFWEFLTEHPQLKEAFLWVQEHPEEANKRCETGIPAWMWEETRQEVEAAEGEVVFKLEGWKGMFQLDEDSAESVAERSAAGQRRKRKLEETLLVEELRMQQGPPPKAPTFTLPLR